MVQLRQRGTRKERKRAAQGYAPGTDVEQEFLNKADEPLRKILQGTNSFNATWCTFLKNLSTLLVMYSFLVIYMNMAGHEVLVIFHVISGACYLSCSFWISQQTRQYGGAVGEDAQLTSGMPFLISLWLAVLSSVVCIAGRILPSIQDVHYKLIPIATGYFAIVWASLWYMRKSARQVQNYRKDLMSTGKRVN